MWEARSKDATQTNKTGYTHTCTFGHIQNKGSQQELAGLLYFQFFKGRRQNVRLACQHDMSWWTGGMAAASKHVLGRGVRLQCINGLSGSSRCSVFAHSNCCAFRQKVPSLSLLLLLLVLVLLLQPPRLPRCLHRRLL